MNRLEQLRERLQTCDDQRPSDDWPLEALQVLTDFEVWARTVPRPRNTPPLDSLDVLKTYEAVAGGSLTTALILTQHVAACELLADCDHPALGDRLLPELGCGRQLATVGISQLSTSRRSKGPAVLAEADGADWRLNGTIPWVTSADHADYVVLGAERSDGMQLLACVPGSHPGLVADPPFELLALQASCTARLHCRNLRLTPREVLRGPRQKVLDRRAAVKPLTVTSVGLGVAGAILDDISAMVQPHTPFTEFHDQRMRPAYEHLRNTMHQAAGRLDDPEAEVPAAELRSAVNDLVTRLAAGLMILAKGSGYLCSHRAQRLLREAAFFLVWSAPTEVQQQTLQRLWAAGGTPDLAT